MFVFIFYRYSNTACELLTSDVSQINDALADSEELVKKLYAFLEMEKPLNPLLASFFSKVMGLLITRKSEMVRISNKMKYVIFYKKNPLLPTNLTHKKFYILSGVEWTENPWLEKMKVLMKTETQLKSLFSYTLFIL